MADRHGDKHDHLSSRSRVYEDGSVTTDPLIIYDLSGSRRDDWAFPQLAAWRGAGWYGSEALPEGAARWMNDHGVIEITSNVEDELELRFEARSVSGVRTLRIAWSDSATSFSVPRDWIACSMRLAVHPGITTLHLVVPEGSVRPIDLPHGTRDGRYLAIAMRNLSVVSLRKPHVDPHIGSQDAACP